MNKSTKKYLRGIGPGGLKCPCCAPAKGSRERKLKFRLMKRSADREALLEGLNHYYDDLAFLKDELNLLEQNIADEERCTSIFDEEDGEFDWPFDDRGQSIRDDDYDDSFFYEDVYAYSTYDFDHDYLRDF